MSHMKSFVTSSALAAVIASAGVAAAADQPSMVGVWKGMATAVHVGETPYRKSDGKISFGEQQIEFTYTIDQQKGALFSGQMSGLDKTETIDHQV